MKTATVLNRLAQQVPMNVILDTLADICAEKAASQEPHDPRHAQQWDKASGKLAVLSVHTPI